MRAEKERWYPMPSEMVILGKPSDIPIEERERIARETGKVVIAALREYREDQAALKKFRKERCERVVR